MFELEKEIARWRAGLVTDSVATNESLEELESHLREEIASQLEAGTTAEKAFEIATRQLGRPEALKREFEKAGEAPRDAWTRRLLGMERDILLPVKAVLLPLLLYFFYAANWLGLFPGSEHSGFIAELVFLGFYTALNLVVAGVLLASRRIPRLWVERAVFAICLADGLFGSLLCFSSGNSVAYLALLGLVVRNTLSFQKLSSQITLNLSLTACYGAVAVFSMVLAGYLGAAERPLFEEAFSGPAHSGSALILLQVAVLLLVSACCAGASFIIDYQEKRLQKT
jgi:hypothetical protein